MNALICKSLEEGDLSLLFNFPRILATKHERTVIEWIVDFTTRYGQPPTIRRLCDQFETFVPISTEGPLGDIYDRELKKKRNLYTREFLLNIQDELKKGIDPLEHIQKLHEAINGGASGILSYTKHDRTSYLRHLHSIPYGIEQIDNYTGGVAQGDLVYVVGRLGSGKTTLVNWMMSKWLLDDHRILMVSNENRGEDIIAKIDAFLGGWNPLKKRTRSWDEADLRRLKGVAHIASKMHGDIIIPDRPILRVSEVVGLVHTYRPDIIIIDGVYLMSGESGSSHWEKITEVSRDLKRLAEAESRPVIGIHQANRGAVGKRVEIENVAYSDALAQDADLLVTVNKEEDSKDIFVECIKNRWGDEGWGFFLRFFFDTMTVRVHDPKYPTKEEGSDA